MRAAHEAGELTQDVSERGPGYGGSACYYHWKTFGLLRATLFLTWYLKASHVNSVFFLISEGFEKDDKLKYYHLNIEKPSASYLS